MIFPSNFITRTLSAMMGIISLIITVSIPLGYFLITRQYITGNINAEIELSGRAIEGLVVNNPKSWQFEEIRLQEILQRRLDYNSQERRTIRNLRGDIIAQVKDPLSNPVIKCDQPIYDSGTQVGSIEFERSISSLATRTVIIGISSLLMGIFLFLVFRFFPLEAVKKAYQNLEENEERLKLAVTSGYFGVWDWEINKNIMLWDDRMYEIHNITKDSVKSVIEAWQGAIHPEDRDRVVEYLRAGVFTEKGVNIEFRILRPDGTNRYIRANGVAIKDISGKILRIIGLYNDITENRNMEEELIRNRKLESLGILAGGIAHDFNNLMAVIMGNVELALMGLPANHKSHLLLRTALQYAEQTNELTGRFITFSGGGLPVRRTRHISGILQETVHEKTKGTAIRIIFDINKNLLPVEVDESQIKQVFQNLTINAVEAMPNGGTLTIRAENTEIFNADNLPLREGSYVRIIFTDNGRGIAEEHFSSIFDPYFTTKNMGDQKGLGLGLSVCYSVLKKHNGHISVTSSLEKGTAFTVYIPALSEKTNEIIQPLISSCNRILIVEDEKHVRAMERAFLEQLGYEVTEATNGQEAIDYYKKALLSDKPFDLVILDLIIQHGLGGQLAMERLLEEDPSIKAIVVSGYVDEPIIEHYKEYGFMGALKKPFHFKEFEEVVKNIICCDKEAKLPCTKVQELSYD